jgi:DNA-binding NarL/FixJ family response regulator
MVLVTPEAADTWPLIGRKANLELIQSHSRNGGVVLIGEAGVGRTRLAREALTRMASRGRQTQWATATRSAAAIRFGALAHLLPALADTRSPLVVGVDDVHLLDDASAGLLYQLVTERRGFVVLTARAGAAVPEAVTALWTAGEALRVDLAALGAEDIAALLAVALDGPIDPVSRQRLQRLSGGNPLLLRELLAAGRETGTLRQIGGVWRWTGRGYVTSRLADVVGDRLGALGPEVRSLAELMACGGPLPLPMLESLAGHDAAVEAERRRLVTTQRCGLRVVTALAHPIYADVIRAGTPRSREREIWQSLAGALGRTPMRRRDDTRLAAKWRRRAELAIPPAELLLAAGRAKDRLDHDLAERLARLARGDGESLTAELLLAEVRVNRTRDPGPAAAPADDLDPGPAEGEVRNRWAAAWQQVRYWAERRRPAGTDATRGRGAPEAASDAARSWLLVLGGDTTEALRVGRAALAAPAIAPAAANWAAAAAIASAGLLGKSDQATRLLRDGLSAARRHEDRAPWGYPQVAAAGCLALVVLGRLGEAAELADRGYHEAVARAADLGADAMPIVGTWAAARGIVARAQGRGQLALASLKEAVAMLDGTPWSRLRRVYLAELAAAYALVGDVSNATERLMVAERVTESPGPLFEVWVQRCRSWVTAAGGDLPAAAGQALQAAALARATEQPSVEALALFDVTRFGTARSGATDQAADRLAALARELRGPVVPTLAAVARAHQWKDSRHALDQAVQLLADRGLLLYAAEIATTAHHHHARAGRRSHAHGSMEHAAALVRACDGAHTHRLVPSGLYGSLTSREQQVALLAAAGHSGPTIAARLGLSKRTVNNYLTRTYDKLGVSGRAQLSHVLHPWPINREPR